MTGSSPPDLVVTFRSIPRRLRESQGDAPFAAVGTPSGDLRARLEDAGRLLGCPAAPDAIADAIAAVKTRDWDDATLDALREIALDIGGHLRAIEAAAAAWRK